MCVRVLYALLVTAVSSNDHVKLCLASELFHRRIYLSWYKGHCRLWESFLCLRIFFFLWKRNGVSIAKEVWTLKEEKNKPSVAEQQNVLTFC